MAESEVRIVLTADAKQMRKTLERQQKQIDGLRKRNTALASSNKNLGSSFGGLAKSISPVTLGVAGLGIAMKRYATESVKAFMRVERGWTEVTTLILDKSKGYTDQLFEDMRSFSKRTGIELEGATRAAYFAISAQIPADQLIEFLEVANKAARGGVTTLLTAVDGMTSALNAYNLSAEDATRVTDAMFTAVRLGKTTFDELAPAIGSVLPLSSALGIELEQVTSAISVLTIQGASTAEAVTRIRGALVALSKDTGAKDLFEELTNQTLPEFIAAGGTLRDALKMIVDNAHTTGETVPKLFGRVEGALAALALQSDEAGEQFTDAMENTAGATEAAFGKMEETTAVKMEKLKANFADFRLSVGEDLTETALFLQDFVNTVNDISPIQLDFIINTDDNTNKILNALTGNAIPLGIDAIEAGLKHLPSFITGALSSGDGATALWGSAFGAATGIRASDQQNRDLSPAGREVWATPNPQLRGTGARTQNSIDAYIQRLNSGIYSAMNTTFPDDKAKTGPDLEARSKRAYGSALDQATSRAFREAIRTENFSLATETANAIHTFSILGARSLETEGEIFAAVQDANFDLSDALREIDDAIIEQLEAGERAAVEQQEADERAAAEQRELTQQLIDEAKAQTQLLAAQGDDYLTQALLAGPMGEQFKSDLALIQLGSLRGRGIASRDFESGAITEERFSSILDGIAQREEDAINRTQQFYAQDTGNLFTAHDFEMYVTIKSDDKPNRRVRAEAGPVQGRPRGACG